MRPPIRLATTHHVTQPTLPDSAIRALAALLLNSVESNGDEILRMATGPIQQFDGQDVIAPHGPPKVATGLREAAS
jgi:hypothetical protein